MEEQKQNKKAQTKLTNEKTHTSVFESEKAKASISDPSLASPRLLRSFLFFLLLFFASLGLLDGVGRESAAVDDRTIVY